MKVTKSNVESGTLNFQGSTRQRKRANILPDPMFSRRRPIVFVPMCIINYIIKQGALNNTWNQEYLYFVFLSGTAGLPLYLHTVNIEITLVVDVVKPL